MEKKLKHLLKGMSENCKLKKYKDKKMQRDGHEIANEESQIFTMQYRTKESSISYSSTRTDGENKVVEEKQRLACKRW